MITTISGLRHRAMFFAIVLVWAYVPIVLALGYLLGTGGPLEAGLLALLAGIVTLEYKRAGPALSAQVAVSVTMAIGVSAIVYLLRGHPWQPDSHMIFFAVFALTAVFCDWRPIVAYAVVIAVHHLVLNYAFTAAVFPGEASFARVLVHAVVLIVQAVPLIWLATVLARIFATSDQLATAAQNTEVELRNSNALQQREKEALQHVIEALGSGLQHLADGNLNKPVTHPFEPQFDALRTDYNAAVAQLSDTIGQVVDVAQNVTLRTTEISSSSENLSRRTENQAAALAQTAAALNKMTESVNAAANSARDVEGIVQRTKKEAEDSNTIVESAVAAMSEIQQSSQQISQIVSAIDDIAFQTNLLALNAGVEAARAGDAGRGFAVVASEVRALAQRSSTAAKEIKLLINASANNVDRGVNQVSLAGQALQSIFTSVAQISARMSDIVVGAKEQSVGLTEINTGVSQLDQVTQQNAAMVEESTAASQLLRQDANTLKNLVHQFRFDGMASPARVEQMDAYKRPAQFKAVARPLARGRAAG